MKGYRFVNPQTERLRKVLIVSAIVLAVIFGPFLIKSLIDYWVSVFGSKETQGVSVVGLEPQSQPRSSGDGDKKDDTKMKDVDNDIIITEPDNLPYYHVEHVRDGDTIDINYEGRDIGVRLIGVNTPETVNPNEPVECFGPESSDYTKSMLSNQTVGIELDSSQGEYDAYNRLLAYVWLNGENYNLKLIENGFAHEYTYDLPYKYQDVFKKAEARAMSSNLGLWSTCVFSGDAQAALR